MKEAGKGDRYRPVDQKKWDEGYERVFGSKPAIQDEHNKETSHDAR